MLGDPTMRFRSGMGKIEAIVEIDNDTKIQEMGADAEIHEIAVDAKMDQVIDVDDKMVKLVKRLPVLFHPLFLPYVKD